MSWAKAFQKIRDKLKDYARVPIVSMRHWREYIRIDYGLRSTSSPVAPSVISDKNNLFSYRKLHISIDG